MTLDVERLGMAWLNAMTKGDHDAECLHPTQAQDCPVGAEVREFSKRVAAEYERLGADTDPESVRSEVPS